MIGLCMDRSLEFGVILAKDNGIASVGCTSQIVQKLKQYEDGRMDILSQGRAIFQLTEFLDEKEYHEAIVEYLPEDPVAQDPGEEKQLLDLFHQCHVALFGNAWVNESSTEIPLAYRIAALLPLALEEKQALLEMREEERRRNFLFNRMTTLLPQIVHRQRVRKSAAGNGHGLN